MAGRKSFISEQTWSQVRPILRFVRDNKARLMRVLASDASQSRAWDEGSGTGGVGVRIWITEWFQISGVNRWRYGGEEIWLTSGTDTYVAKPGGLKFAANDTINNPPLPYLLNVREGSNGAQGSGWQGNSVNDSGQDYPPGFAMQPIGGGSGGVVGIKVPVTAFAKMDSLGIVRWEFEATNSDDGTCT